MNNLGTRRRKRKTRRRKRRGGKLVSKVPEPPCKPWPLCKTQGAPPPASRPTAPVPKHFRTPSPSPPQQNKPHNFPAKDKVVKFDPARQPGYKVQLYQGRYTGAQLREMADAEDDAKAAAAKKEKEGLLGRVKAMVGLGGGGKRRRRRKTRRRRRNRRHRRKTRRNRRRRRKKSRKFAR